MSDPFPNPKPFPRVNGLFKQHSWSPDLQRDEAWHRREEIYRERRLTRSKSVTDEDLDEIQACVDLGFVDADGFSVGDAEAKKLSETFPGLDMYYAVKKGLKGFAAASASSSPAGSMASAASVGSSASDLSPMGSPVSLFSPGDTLDMKKERLKQWAHVVGWSVRRNSEKKRRGALP
ncbi:hypothetical protein LUZ63_008268 [Rhynchospora breviuscula]|uniref:Uncharacterized protein n=1 Tax=Rhynchospora breviuscula TaxID=2022672 RepID=A0A9Q0CTA1_9POAL|nr:hypothetical protein LUZ63_008268 [Rhynchospora breviuscula]